MPPRPVSSDLNGLRDPGKNQEGGRAGWVQKILSWITPKRRQLPIWEGMEAIEAIKLLQVPDLRGQFGLDADGEAHLLALPGQISGSADPVQEAAHRWREILQLGLISTDDLRYLRKLVWHRRGEAALANPEFRAKLRLNRRQGDAIESILESARAKLDAISQDSERPLVREKLGKELTDILSSEQLRIWKHLVAVPS